MPSSDSKKWELQFQWKKVVFIGILHIWSLYGAYLFFAKAKWQTCLFTYFIYLCGLLGVTAGVHRLWSHKAYKAKLPLRIILLTFYTMAFQDSVIMWARHHRIHHKYCDTDADPYNSTRGLIFSHIGWLLVRPNPEVIDKRRTVDLSDLWSDPLLRFQNNYYVVLSLLITAILPTFIPVLWGEKMFIAFFVTIPFRLVFSMHITSLVNSAAHKWGNKPYDKNIRPTEIKTVSFLTVGEGFHNYHHTFPWDYKSAELGGYSLNITKLFIDMMAKIGWAYDLKSVSNELIERRAKRTGDGTHPVWGWDDPDFPVEDKKAAITK